MFLTIGSVFYLILLFVPFFFWGPRLFRCFRHLSIAARAAILLVLSWQVFQLALYYPGQISSDDTFLWEPIHADGIPSAWHSLTYSFLTQGWAWITAGPYHLSLMNLGLFAFVLLLTFRVLPSKISLWTIAGLALIFSMPQSSALVFFQNRDSLNSILLVWLFLGLLSPRTPARQDPWFHPWTLMALSLVLGDLRQEGKFLLLLTPFSLWWVSEAPVLDLVKKTASLLLIGAVFYGIPSFDSSYQSYSPSYQSTLFLNPLGYILHVRGSDAGTPEEIRTLETLVTVSQMNENYEPLDIDPFHNGFVKNLEPEQFDPVKKTVLSIFWKNRDLFLENRLFIASHILNFQGTPLMFAVEFPSSVATWHLGFIRQVAFELPRSVHFFLSSFLLPLVVLLLGLSCARSHPEVFTSSVVNLTRLAIVLAAAPAGYFKYVSSSWIFGWILLFYLLETRRGSEEPLES